MEWLKKRSNFLAQQISEQICKKKNQVFCLAVEM